MAATQELVIDDTPGEIRVALMEEGRVVEVDISRSAHHSQIGNIYRGRVDSVVPSLQAAFVTLGDGPQGFLSARDATALADPDGPHRPTLETIVHEGQWVLVQVTRDAVGDKGPRMTASVTLPGRFLVYQPLKPGIAISSKISAEDERTRLQTIMGDIATALDVAGGFIIRTVAEGVTEDTLRKEAESLGAEWAHVQENADTADKPVCIFEEDDSVERALRDWASPDVEKITLQGHALFARVKNYVAEHLPDLADRLEVHTGTELLFEDRGIESALEAVLEKRLDVEGGGWVAIETTEALTAVDVNSGRRDQESDRERMALGANLAAVPTIAYQLRLRDIGGQVVIDFINMNDSALREQVSEAMEQAMAPDRAPHQILGWTRLGLLEITRRRSRGALQALLSGGRSQALDHLVRSPETTGYDILRLAQLEADNSQTGDIVIHAHKSVIDWLNDGRLATLAGLTSRTIEAEVDDEIETDEFDIYTE